MKALVIAIALFAVVTPSLAESKKQLSETLSNISKTRSEISMTFARNSRG